jgi:hypothetical protein
MKTWLSRLGYDRRTWIVVVLVGVALLGAAMALFCVQFATHFMGDPRDASVTVAIELGRDTTQTAAVAAGDYDMELVTYLAPLPAAEREAGEKQARGKMSWSVGGQTGEPRESGNGYLVDPTLNRADGQVFNFDITYRDGSTYCTKDIATRVHFPGGPASFHVDLSSLQAVPDSRIRNVNMVLRKSENSFIYFALLALAGVVALVTGVVVFGVLTLARRGKRQATVGQATVSQATVAEKSPLG